jgi:hypothetical protein
MSIGFNPQNPNVKSAGREELANLVSIPLSEFEPFFKDAEPETFQANYNNFVDRFPKETKVMSDMRPDGVGPGELPVWFVFNNIQLGGKNSSIDLTIDGADFAEMKGGRYETAHHAIAGFKITKDSDPAVDLLRRDLDEFNLTYRKITGINLTGWEPGSIKTTTLADWDLIDLKKEAKRFAGPLRGKAQLIYDLNGDIFTEDGTIITNCTRKGYGAVLRKFMQADIEIAVNNNVSTLKRIIDRWRRMAFDNYLSGKRFALVNTKSLRMEHFGELSVDMIGLLRIGRNQPEARIYLPKGNAVYG